MANLNQTETTTKTMAFDVPKSFLNYLDKTAIPYTVKDKGQFTDYWRIEMEITPYVLTVLLLCGDKHGIDRAFVIDFRLKKEAA
jgi:hypothetical protein